MEKTSQSSKSGVLPGSSADRKCTLKKDSTNKQSRANFGHRETVAMGQEDYATSRLGKRRGDRSRSSSPPVIKRACVGSSPPAALSICSASICKFLETSEGLDRASEFYLSCDDGFHAICLLEHIEKQQITKLSCPVCKQSLDEQETTELICALQDMTSVESQSSTAAFPSLPEMDEDNVISGRYSNQLWFC